MGVLVVQVRIPLLSGGEVCCLGLPLGLPCSSPELGPDEILRFRFKAPRIRGRVDGTGDGEGSEGEELSLSPSTSTSTKTSGHFLGAFDLTVAVTVEALDSVDRVDLTDFGFVADLRVDFGFESDLCVITRVCGPGLDLGETIRLVGGASKPRLCSSSEGASRVGDLFPFGFGLVLALGLKSDLAGDSEGDLTFLVASPMIDISFTFSAGEPLS